MNTDILAKQKTSTKENDQLQRNVKKHKRDDYEDLQQLQHNHQQMNDNMETTQAWVGSTTFVDAVQGKNCTKQIYTKEDEEDMTNVI